MYKRSAPAAKIRYSDVIKAKAACKLWGRHAVERKEQEPLQWLMLVVFVADVLTQPLKQEFISCAQSAPVPRCTLWAKPAQAGGSFCLVIQFVPKSKILVMSICACRIF